MKLKHLNKHPHHGTSTISDGTPLYIYQEEACYVVIKDIKSKTKKDNKGHINILKIPTGDGKTFITEQIVRLILDLDTKNKTIFLCSPFTRGIRGHQSKNDFFKR